MLEELDLKRRGVVMSGKWAQKIQVLNQEASAALEVGEQFKEASELLGRLPVRHALRSQGW